MSLLSSLFLSFLDRANIIVTGTVAAFVLYSRSAGVTYFALASIACSISAKVIKKLVRQARPAAEVVAGRRAKKSYGMPSTHSSVVTFQSLYVLLACRSLPIHPSFPQNPLLSRVLPPLVVLPWAAAIMVSRVRLRYHTWAQVGAGFAWGVVFALVMFGAWTNGLDEYGRVVEDYVERVIMAWNMTSI